MRVARSSQRVPGPSLAVEIAVVLAVKAAALVVLWWAFFSEPAAPSLRVAPGLLEQRFFAQPAQENERDAERNGR